MIHARQAIIGYPNKRAVLNDFSIHLASGQIHGLIGANGVGKTTLLRTLAGQLRPGGELTVFGEKPFDNAAVMDRTVLMGVDAPLPAGWSARKLFKIGQARFSTWSAQRAEHLAQRFDIPMSTRYSELSVGQRGAVGITFAFASGCELVLLDEPYSGLDLEKRAVFYEELNAERRRTIIISTHHLHEVEVVLDTAVLLADGSVELAGPIDDLTSSVLRVAGRPEALSSALAELGNPAVLHRKDAATGTQMLLDLRGRPDLSERAFALDSVNVRETSVEEAVRALTMGGGNE